MLRPTDMPIDIGRDKLRKGSVPVGTGRRRELVVRVAPWADRLLTGGPAVAVSQNAALRHPRISAVYNLPPVTGPPMSYRSETASHAS